MFDALGLSFALLVSAGGVFGYYKSDSVVSLVSGLTFGVLLALGSFQLGQDNRKATILFLSSGLLSAVMGFRFAKTGKLMPAGVFCSLGLLMAIRSAYIMWK
uniref:Transmembrane protein 14C n=1 Tax=Schistocephalus solidus TaxID=70667 RepID=A0A0X3P676_SCHSO